MTEPVSSRALYARLLRHVWPYRGAVAAGIAGAVIGGAIAATATPSYGYYGAPAYYGYPAYGYAYPSYGYRYYGY